MLDRLIQFIALWIFVAGIVCNAFLLPETLKLSDKQLLRYTDDSVKGAPPIVVLGTAIGPLRGLIADYLWIKVNHRKEEGLFFEVMADSEWITKLQPRFPKVWAFIGHNLSYNISVATHTLAERKDWVWQGIDLVRNQGLRYNPDSLELHKELAFWFGHKIEGVADDAHLFYKQEFSTEWHFLLGEPPLDTEERIAWIKTVADAPKEYDDLLDIAPEAAAIVKAMRSTYSKYLPERPFELDQQFLREYVLWQAIKSRSAYAQEFDLESHQKQQDPYFAAIDAAASNPQWQNAWDLLIAHTRKKILLDQYNMDPQLMYAYTRDYGPLDWRSGFAHQFFWARKGEEAEKRMKEGDDIVKVMNNDRNQIHAMQGMARYGRITFDPFSEAAIGRYPEQRWIDVIIMRMFDHLYIKHLDTRGWGGDAFIEFVKNFGSSSVRELYREGKLEHAQKILDWLNERFGRGSKRGDPRFTKNLRDFVVDEVKGEVDAQPHIAVSEVLSALRNGFRFGVGRDDMARYEEAKKYASLITKYFQEKHDFNTKFLSARMADIVDNPAQAEIEALVNLLVDPTVSLLERSKIYNLSGQVSRPQGQPDLRLAVYDLVMQPQFIPSHYNGSLLSQHRTLDQLFPRPAGLDVYRARKRREAEQRGLSSDQATDIEQR